MIRSHIYIHNGSPTGYMVRGYVASVGETSVGFVQGDSSWYAYRQPDGAALNRGNRTRAEALKVARKTLRQIKLLSAS